MSNALKKFNENSDSPMVDFAKGGLVMILTNDRTQLRTLSVNISNGMTSALHRIANNVPEDADVEEIVNNWLNSFSEDGTENTIVGEVYANHNIIGMGRPVLLDTGVQLQKDIEGNPKVVFRFARWFAPNTRTSFTADFEKANGTLRRNLIDVKEDLEVFKDDKAEYAKIVKEYSRIRGMISENNQKVSILENPYIPGMSTAYVSTDEEEIKLAFKNSNLDFDKIYPDGIEFGADTSNLKDESDAGIKTGEATEKTAETPDPLQQAANEAVLETAESGETKTTKTK